MNNNSSQQDNLDQAQHDKMMLAMTDDQRHSLAVSLAQLMRSKVASESSSSPDASTRKPSEKSKTTRPGPG